MILSLQNMELSNKNYAKLRTVVHELRFILTGTREASPEMEFISRAKKTRIYQYILNPSQILNSEQRTFLVNKTSFFLEILKLGPYDFYRARVPPREGNAFFPKKIQMNVIYQLLESLFQRFYHKDGVFSREQLTIHGESIEKIQSIPGGAISLEAFKENLGASVVNMGIYTFTIDESEFESAMNPPCGKWTNLSDVEDPEISDITTEENDDEEDSTDDDSSYTPSVVPSVALSAITSVAPSAITSLAPSVAPSVARSVVRSVAPSVVPTVVGPTVIGPPDQSEDLEMGNKLVTAFVTRHRNKLDRLKEKAQTQYEEARVKYKGTSNFHQYGHAVLEIAQKEKTTLWELQSKLIDLESRNPDLETKTSKHMAEDLLQYFNKRIRRLKEEIPETEKMLEFLESQMNS